jgi:AcrR family transcriptional regulator
MDEGDDPAFPGTLAFAHPTFSSVLVDKRHAGTMIQTFVSIEGLIMSSPEFPDGKDTKRRVLDAAEQLFADQGFKATSLRQITSAAGANLAAVNYHFGSKEELMVEVLSRRLEPMNRERLDLLERLESTCGTEGPGVEAILEAFLGPPLRMKRDAGKVANLFLRLLGHAMNESSDRVQGLVIDRFREVGERFMAALCRALPRAPRPELAWSLVFGVGAMIHALHLSETRLSSKLAHLGLDATDSDAMLARMVRFLGAGLEAASPGTSAGGAS